MANKYLDDVGLTHLWTKIKDYVSANSNKYTLPTATTSTLGGVKLGSDTVQTVAAVNPATATRSRTYAIQKNSNGQLVVNVPWTDTKPHIEAADIIYWDKETNPQLVEDLIRIFNTNDEVNYSRAATIEESGFFETIMSEIRGGRRVSGIYICSSASILNSGLIAYLQLSLINQITITFTVYNLEQTGTPTYGYIVEYSNGGLFIAKTQLATKYDLGSYATRTSVQEVKNAVDKIKDRIIYTTYEELKALRDEGNLIPGQQYQITDYITTTNPNDSDIQSAGHQFDIIVVADNAFTLNENARATYHKNSNNNNYYDNYFFIEEHDKQVLIGADFKEGLTKQDVNIIFSMTEEDGFYSPHDSAQRIDDLITFTNPEGKEVPALLNRDPEQGENDIYYVYIETSKFAIKNKSVSIQYKLVDNEVAYTQEDLDMPFFEGWGNDVFVDFDYRNNIPVMYKTDTNLYSLSEPDYDDCYIYAGDIEIDGEEYNLWEKEEDGELTPYSFATQKIVSNNRFIKTIEELKSEFEYETYDKWQEYNVPRNEFNSYWHYSEPVVDPVYESVRVPAYKAALLEVWEIKYSLDNNSAFFNWVNEDNGKGVIYYLKDEYNNIAFYDFKNIRFYDGHNGKFAYTFGGEKDRTLKNEENLYVFMDNSIGYCFDLEENYYYLGQNIFYGSQIDTGSCSNRIGNDSKHNKFKENCNSNKIGNHSEYNTFLEKCDNNFLGDYCNDIYLASSCCNNTINSNSGEISIFGENSTFNYFESTCSAISLERTSSLNYFNSCCDNIYIEKGNNNSFGLSCQNIDSNILKNCIFENNVRDIDTNCDWENIHIENGVQYIDIRSQDGSPIYNATFSSGIEGTSSNKKFISANSATGGDKVIYHPRYTSEILLD